MNSITIENIIKTHDIVIQETGGEEGILNSSLIESAYYSAFQTFGGKEFYPSVVEKAARIGYGLMSNHRFVDGNKRTGMLILDAFLDVNGYLSTFSEEDGEAMAWKVAAHEIEYEDFYDWLQSNVIKVSQ